MRLSDTASPALRKLNRNIAIAGSVVLFHLAALWALQAGLLRRVTQIAQVVVPVEIVSEAVTPPAPKVEPPAPPPAPEPPAAVKRPAIRKPERKLPPAPAPPAIPEPQPAPNAPTGALAPQPPVPAAAVPVAPEPPPSAPSPSAGHVELPSSGASYLQNPAPVYPAISKRLGEQGKAVVRVLIGADGTPQKVELKRSSGYDRLDRAAVDYVMKCRYVPGKVGGVPQAMWYEAPVSFVLE